MAQRGDRVEREARLEREVLHGKRLAEGRPVDIWGWSSPAGRVRARRRADLIAAGAGLRPGVRALEIGCGTGLFTAMFAASGASITAVDLSGELLALARSSAPPNVTFLQKSFEDSDVDGPFGAVIGSSILHHLDVAVALPKILTLLEPGGWRSFAEPNMLNPQIALQKNVPWIKRRLGDSPDETAFFGWSLASRLRAVGFDDVEVTPFDWLHPMTPSPLIAPLQKIGRLIESTPLLRQFAGS